MENNVKRNVEFDGIVLTRNPLKQPYYDKQSVIDVFADDSCLMDRMRNQGVFGEFGAPTFPALKGVERLKAMLFTSKDKTAFRIESVSLELYQTDNVEIFYPQAVIAMCGPLANKLLENWGRLRFRPRVLSDHADDSVYKMSRIITWDAIPTSIR